MHSQPDAHIGCDTGEAVAGSGRDRELALLPYMSAVSIACGGHAGDEDSIRELVTAASVHGCLLGAHPSYPDKEGFGRRAIEIDQDSLASSLRDQLALFVQVVEECHERVSFIKAHGALYHTIASDSEFAHWYWDLCTSIIPHARFVGPIGSLVLDEFRASGIPVYVEGFCDRVYEADGTLRLRSMPGSCITDPEIAAAQADRLINESGCNFLCVHSDTDNAIEIARVVRERLHSSGIDI